MSEKKMRTRFYYTDYVNHMVRFYISCQDSILVEGKRRADIENWVAVQGVLHLLPEENRVRVIDVYKTHNNLPKAVELYCEKTGAEKAQVWSLLTKVSGLIAKARGLV